MQLKSKGSFQPILTSCIGLLLICAGVFGCGGGSNHGDSGFSTREGRRPLPDSFDVILSATVNTTGSPNSDTTGGPERPSPDSISGSEQMDLRVLTSPDSAQVTLRRREAGSGAFREIATPADLTLPEGGYEFTVQKEGFRDTTISRALEAEGSRTDTLRVALTEVASRKSRTFTVRSVPPKATVVLRNASTGAKQAEQQTPATFTVPPGRYSWIVRKEGYQTHESPQPVDLTTRSSFQKQVDLSPKERHTLKFQTSPENATLILRNANTGTKIAERETPASLRLSPGQYEWTVQKSGYDAKQSEIDLRGRSEVVRRVKLSRERHVLRFDTSPTSATVTLRNTKTGDTLSARTPHEFEVLPGYYSWTVQRMGFATQESAQPVNLSAQEADTVSIELQKANISVERLMKNGEQALDENNYQKAVDYYQRVPEPGSQQDDTYYLRALNRIAEAYIGLENYQKAIASYEKILERAPNEYETFLNLARVHFELENHDKVLKNLNRVDQLRNRIPSGRRQTVLHRIDYRRALVYYQKFEDAEDPTQKRTLAIDALTKFKEFLQAVPSDQKSNFKRQIQGAQRKLKTLREFLN